MQPWTIVVFTTNVVQTCIRNYIYISFWLNTESAYSWNKTSNCVVKVDINACYNLQSFSVKMRRLFYFVLWCPERYLMAIFSYKYFCKHSFSWRKCCYSIGCPFTVWVKSGCPNTARVYTVSLSTLDVGWPVHLLCTSVYLLGSLRRNMVVMLQL